MFDTRKYFDYELAYNGYLKALEVCKNGGLNELKGKYYTHCDLDNLQDYEYICFEDYDHNIHFDYIIASGELHNVVEVINYASFEDNIDILDIKELQNRIDDLTDYAIENNYTIEDIEYEYNSLISVIEKIAHN